MLRNGAALQTTEQTGGPQTMRCAIYTRKSTTAGLEQDFNSLDAQRDACLYFIRSQAHARWVHTATFEDGGYSGANTERPGFQRLMEAVSSRQVDVVIVYKVDRLSRSLSDFSQIMQTFQGHQVAFVSVTQNFSTADAIGRLTLNMLMSFAEFEREMIAERTRDKIASARRRGLWMGGSVPFGYRNDGGKLVPVQGEVQIVQEIFTLYLERQYSALAIAQCLNERQEPSRARKRRVQADAGGWTKMAVLRALQNPIYIGKIPHHGEVYEGEHAGIIDPQVFARAQEELEKPELQRLERMEDPYLLRGLLRCAHCEAYFTGLATKNRQGRSYRYYRCTSKDRHGAKACQSKPLPSEALERLVTEQLRQALSQEALLHEVTQGARLRLAEEEARLNKACATLPEAIAAKANLLRALTTRAPGPELAALIEESAKEIEALRKQLEQSEQRRLSLRRTEIELVWVRQVVNAWERCWEAMTTQNKQRLLRAMIMEIRLDTGREEMELELQPWVRAATHEERGAHEHA